MSRRRVDYKDCDSDADVCDFCGHTREEHEDNFGHCEFCGCRKFWDEAKEMAQYDDDESDESDA